MFLNDYDVSYCSLIKFEYTYFLMDDNQNDHENDQCLSVCTCGHSGVRASSTSLPCVLEQEH